MENDKHSEVVASATCNHNYQYGGVRYHDTKKLRLGSGATVIEYYELYYCTQCLDRKLFELDHESNSYNPILFNASPLDTDLLEKIGG